MGLCSYKKKLETKDLLKDNLYEKLNRS